MIIGGLRLVTRGLSSRHGDVSRDEAVDEPPGDSMTWFADVEGSTVQSRFYIFFIKKKIIKKKKKKF